MVRKAPKTLAEQAASEAMKVQPMPDEVRAAPIIEDVPLEPEHPAIVEAAKVAASPPPPPTPRPGNETAWKRVKVKAYKVRTSQGRLIEGQIAELPPSEANDLIASGAVVHVPIN